MATRYCIINPNGGKIKVYFSITNALNAGADFKLLSTSSQIIDNWKMISGTSGTDAHEINKPQTELNKKGLSWQILICTMKSQIDKGTVELQIRQDNVSCQITKPMHWEITGIPFCEDGKALPISGGLIFLNK